MERMDGWLEMLDRKARYTMDLTLSLEIWHAAAGTLMVADPLNLAGSLVVVARYGVL